MKHPTQLKGRMMRLNWPKEYAGSYSEALDWHQAGSNLCLDFHGDPLKAQLAVYSDGNHHMALEESLQNYIKTQNDIKEIFYITTPPGPIVNMLQKGSLILGNLTLSIKPHLFISPRAVLEKLQAQNLLGDIHPFMQNRGAVLLVKKGNPLGISDVASLLKAKARLFISNPEKEGVSYQGYYDTLLNLGLGSLDELDVCYGERIHHREAPQSIADDKADVAIVFYHLALRYTRIFPELFEIVPLGGTAEDPQPLDGNVISDTAIAVVKGEEAKGEALLAYMQSDLVTDIYQRHGLLRFK